MIRRLSRADGICCAYTCCYLYIYSSVKSVCCWGFLSLPTLHAYLTAPTFSFPISILLSQACLLHLLHLSTSHPTIQRLTQHPLELGLFKFLCILVSKRRLYVPYQCPPIYDTLQQTVEIFISVQHVINKNSRLSIYQLGNQCPFLVGLWFWRDRMSFNCCLTRI